MKCFLLLLTTLLTLLPRETDSFNVHMNEDQFNSFLKSGSLDGFFTFDEFWHFYEGVRNNGRNSLFISSKVTIGKSYEGRNIDGFYICDDTSQLSNYLKTKSIALFTALHHAREPLSLTMVMLMMREILKLVTVSGHNKMKEFLRDNVVFFVPFVNVDSYIYINKHFEGPNCENIKMIRKNRHVVPSACSEDWLGGVDLNRNYDMKFAADESGSSSDPCQEDFRGAQPFSEPETQAIRNYVESHPTIVSDVNIHTFGNAWIYPYNYVKDKTNHLLEVNNRLFFDFYNEFKKDITQTKHLKALFGNAAFTLDYSTNGEAGDWFTAKQSILNIDVELGSLDSRSEQFYPPKSILANIVRYNWIVMKEFLYRHIVRFEHKIVVYPDRVSFEIVNLGLATLSHARLEFHILSHSGRSIRPKDSRCCVKNLVDDTCSDSVPFTNAINMSFKGRHVLELQFFFESSRDIETVGGVQMKVVRHNSFMDYKDQVILFKSHNKALAI